VSARSPNQRLAPTQSDEFERRSRLISLVYEVLHATPMLAKAS
jgi:hypothetical protein